MLSSLKKIIKIKIGQKKVALIFDDGDKLEISPNTYTEYNFYVGKSLTKKDIKGISFNNDIDKYMGYITKLVAQKSYSKHEIKEKLAKKGANEAQIELIIDKLIKYQLIDETSLIKEYLDYADYKHYGYNRIKEDLYKKGISSIYIERIKYDETRDLKQARSLIKGYEKKYSKYNYSSMKAHIYQALLRMGYSYDVSNKALEDVSPIDVKKEQELLKEDYKKAKAKYEKKYGPYETKDKITQYLISKGYRYEDIKSLKE